jgi:hypothetical protein
MKVKGQTGRWTANFWKERRFDAHSAIVSLPFQKARDLQSASVGG